MLFENYYVPCTTLILATIGWQHYANTYIKNRDVKNKSYPLLVKYNPISIQLLLQNKFTKYIYEPLGILIAYISTITIKLYELFKKFLQYLNLGELYITIIELIIVTIKTILSPIIDTYKSYRKYVIAIYNKSLFKRFIISMTTILLFGVIAYIIYYHKFNHEKFWDIYDSIKNIIL